ncbi:metal-dependent hydrolase family protein [Microbacterium sp. ASV49]|uniref:Amidohydrolase family protein n=1 Tax=Microbacterium candidum TaxID=3041922 RepID=A0ABT7MW76_9MICO|nr:amidohydrolase family protein [Microbacterium sp. ASV49]MDL9978691.1 amidohydrolase family protein [Microbacterium sp. ASV49]
MTRTVFAGGEVFDGTGAPALLADVAIEGGRIVEVAPGLTGDDIHDVTGKLIIPGLIDAHAHAQFDGMDVVASQQQPFSLQFFEAERNLRTILASGITTIRDAGGIDLGVKTALERGMIAGPRALISISVLSQTGGHVDGWNVHGDHQRLLVPHPGRPDCVVDGVEGMRQRVRELLRAGADTIKVCATGGVMSTRDDPRHSQFSLDELVVCVEEARAAGKDVLAHAQGAAGIKNALRAGVRSIEHGIFLDDECIELFLETGAWLVPTLLAPAALIESIDAGMRVTPEMEVKARSVVEVHRAAIARAHAAGVRIAMGTDAGVFPHGQASRELVFLIDAGMSPEEALVAATSGAAELLRLSDEIGTVTAGKAADLLVLGGDAWNLAAFAENLETVVQAGQIVEREANAT